MRAAGTAYSSATMGFDVLGGAGHGDVGVRVDGNALRARLVPRLAMGARRSERVLVPDRH